MPPWPTSAAVTIDPDGWPEPDRWSIWAGRGDLALELVAERGRVIAAVPHLAYLIGHSTRVVHECLLIEGYEVRKEPYRLLFNHQQPFR